MSLCLLLLLPMPANCAEPAHLCCCAVDDGDGEIVCLALRCGPPVGSILHAAGLLLLPETSGQQQQDSNNE